jgi:hypothetical protein
VIAAVSIFIISGSVGSAGIIEDYSNPHERRITMKKPDLLLQIRLLHSWVVIG